MRFLIINPPNLDVTLSEGISIFDWLIETKQIVLYYMAAEDKPAAKPIDLSPFINKLNSLNFERIPQYSSVVVKAYLELFYLISKLFCEINSIKKDEQIFVSWVEGVESKIKVLFENITAYKKEYSMVHERDVLILKGWLQLAKINLIFASFNVLKFERCVEFLLLFESSISEIDWSVMPVRKNCVLCNQCLAVASLIKMPLNIKLYGLLAKAILRMCESSDNPQENFPVQLLEEVERVLIRADADSKSIETSCIILKNAKPFIYFLLLFEAYFGKKTKYIAFSKHIYRSEMKLRTAAI